jgi:hypothetical protein
MDLTLIRAGRKRFMLACGFLNWFAINQADSMNAVTRTYLIRSQVYASFQVSTRRGNNSSRANASIDSSLIDRNTVRVPHPRDVLVFVARVGGA